MISDDGLGDGDTAGDVQAGTIGTADVSGLLRAERSGKGGGRTYTLIFEGREAARSRILQHGRRRSAASRSCISSHIVNK